MNDLKQLHFKNFVTTHSTYQSIAFLVQLACLYVILKAFYNRYLHPLANVPGPPLASVSQLWKRFADWRYRRAHYILTAHQKYGPVIRIAPNGLSFANPAVLQKIYGHKGFIKSDVGVQFLKAVYRYNLSGHCSSIRLGRCIKKIISSAHEILQNTQLDASLRLERSQHSLLRNSNL